MKSDDIFSQNMKYSIDFSKIYLETSKTRPSISLLAVTLNIFHPSPTNPGTEPKHVKTSFLKVCLAICIEKIQHEEVKDQLTHRRS